MRKFRRLTEFADGLLSRDPQAKMKYDHANERDTFENDESDARTFDVENEDSAWEKIMHAAEQSREVAEFWSGIRGDHALLAKEETKYINRISKLNLRSLEAVERKRIGIEVTERYAFFQSRHTQIQDLLATQREGYEPGRITLTDEDGFDFVTPPSSTDEDEFVVVDSVDESSAQPRR